MSRPGNEWLDEDAGPVVRSYALTRGRARPSTRGEELEMIAIIAAVPTAPELMPELGPEHLAILELCGRPQSVAEIAGRLGLPLVVVRVLLGDLLGHGLVTVRRPGAGSGHVNQGLLREVLHGLEAL
ncbi:DUF742 domain-containing protein [Spirillospora sp. CA-294931]|uniref:DUF742 domain-containing protein n=1 Tax=Spirillospora sp. CA-294931 TaxID=3240042 RepID=UPI003D8ED077